MKLIQHIDAVINKQINIILHNSLLQKLEASWRGLLLLLNAREDDTSTVIKILNISAKVLAKNIEHAVDFDQSALFKKIYEQEFDQPGGQPFGLIIADYYFNHNIQPDIPDCIYLLRELAKIASSAFCPIVVGIAPNFFGINSFSEIQIPFQVKDLLQQKEYERWKQIRIEEDSHYLGLVLPRIRMRPLYQAITSSAHNRFFTESAEHHDDYLWGNASYAFACTVITSYRETGWFSDMRGIHQKDSKGGVVDIYRDYYSTDEDNLIAKNATEYAITDTQEKILSEAGFIVLKDNRYLEKAIFYNMQTLQQPIKFTTKTGTVNASLSSLLHYVLCVSRFAHYIKMILRDRIGGFSSARECELFLDSWLHQYRAQNTTLTRDVRTKYPLREAKVKVTENKSMPGKYHCIMHLKPQYQIDEIELQFRLITQVKLN